MGGWMLAIGEMRGDLAELTRRLRCAPDDVGAAAVVFPIALPGRGTLYGHLRTEEGRGLRPRTVRVS